MITIYHNPRCGKSRTACDFFTSNNNEFAVFLYLQLGLNRERIEEILEKGNYQPLDIIRVKEDVFKTKFKDKNLSREDYINALIENPILLERPIVVGLEKAMIVRSEESLHAAIASVK